MTEGECQYDDVIKWKHFQRYWPFVRGIPRSPVNSPHKGQWRGALMFSLICTWMNDWVNNRKAGDLKHHRAHYDVMVMNMLPFIWWIWRNVSSNLYIHYYFFGYSNNISDMAASTVTSISGLPNPLLHFLLIGTKCLAHTYAYNCTRLNVLNVDISQMQPYISDILTVQSMTIVSGNWHCPSKELAVEHATNATHRKKV